MRYMAWLADERVRVRKDFFFAFLYLHPLVRLLTPLAFVVGVLS
jgi:hypothetical protein